MYRKPRFLKVLHAIREQMSREVDYDVDLFVEMVRAGERANAGSPRRVRAYRLQKNAAGVQGAAEVAAATEKRRKRAAR
ncbi:MAG: hypothetical protein QOE77_1848 [Blastocatellia bacterium]|jgi:hypothetical protein|nr:hypothetical protein [Blastocatellia bacterium]